MKSRIQLSKTVSLFLSIAILLTATLAASSTVRADVDSWFKAWTTVGSAGTIDEASTSKLVMNGSFISFPDLILPPLPTDTFEPAERLGFAAAALPLETVTGTVRYNVVATDGLFENGAYLGMRARLRDNGDNAQVVLRLYEVNIDTGATVPVLTLNSDSFPASANYQTVGTSIFVGSNRINFQQNAYFIEATLTKKQSSVTPIGGGKPGIAVIQLQKFTPIL